MQYKPMTNLAGKFRVYALWPDGHTLKEAIKIEASQQNAWDIRPAAAKPRNRRFVLSMAWIIVFSLLALGVASFALLI